jgi:diguanylate cyclase (GGDEF)-like protein
MATEERQMPTTKLDEYKKLTELANQQKTTCLAALEAFLSAKETVALLAANMDRMHRLNDCFGFSVGDSVLFAVRSIFKNRFGDDFYWQGNEFIAFIVGEAVSRVHEVEESIRSDVKKLRFERHPDLIPSISVGLTICENDGRTPSQLLRDAEDEIKEARRTNAIRELKQEKRRQQ